MSYILEALKKSDAERKRSEETVTSDESQNAPELSEVTRKPWAAMIASSFAVVAVFGLAVTFWMNDDSPEKATSPAPQEMTDQHVQMQPKAPPALEPKPMPEPEPEPAPMPEPEPEPAPMPEPKPAPMPEPEPAPEPAPEAEPAPEPAQMLKPEPAPMPMPEAQPKPKPVHRAASLEALSSANAYVDRAWASMNEGLYGQAINDLDIALSMEPAFSDAWFAHGWANEKNGNVKAAILDYNRAIDAKPDHAFALFSRGFLKLYDGKPGDAAVDFVRTQGVATEDDLRLYSRLWLYLSRERAGQNGRARLKEDISSESLNFWPGPLIQYFVGDMTEDDVLKSIEGAHDNDIKERQATGYFFLGISQQLTGNAHNARSYFEKTLATGAVEFRQYDAARRELERLNR